MRIVSKNAFSFTHLYLTLLLVGLVAIVGLLIFFQKVYATQSNEIGVTARVLPRFSFTFDGQTVNIASNMKIVINGKEIKN